MDTRKLLAPTAALVCALASCTYSTPYSAHSLAQDSVDDPRRALLNYLSQPNADGRVCSSAAKPRAHGIDAKVLKAVVKALDKDKLKRGATLTCLELVLAELPDAEREDTLMFVASRYAKALSQDRARTLHKLVMKVASQPADAAILANTRKQLKTKLASKSYSHTSAREAAAFVDMLGLLVGEWQGELVERETILAETDRHRLRLFAEKLPDEALARLARGQLIRLEAQASTYPEVTDNLDSVVEGVLNTGRNALDLESHTIVSANFDTARAPLHRLKVKQRTMAGSATLFASRAGSETLMPVLDIKDWLQFEIEGISKAVTLCRPRGENHPDPCVEAKNLQVDERIMSLDDDGLLTLRDTLSIRDAIRFLSEGGGLDINVHRGERTLASVTLPMYFQTPEPFIREGRVGAKGPSLIVDIGQVGEHLIFKVSEGGEAWTLVVHEDGLSTFRIASRGGQGQAGTRGQGGSMGRSGTRGTNAHCPSGNAGRGGNGTRGGDGRNGGHGHPGGDGGNITVKIHCGQACADLRSSWPAIIESLPGKGGAGGQGGQGGSGGRGGDGGSATTCRVTSGYGDNKRTTTKSLSSGMRGSSGIRGTRGSKGAPGPQGKAGRVTISPAKN